MTFEEWKWEMSTQLEEMSFDDALKVAWDDQQDRINRLLLLLDDIDTAGDIFKPTIDGYFRYVQRKVKEAHIYRIEGWDEL